MKKWTDAERSQRLFYYILFLFFLTLWLRFVVVGIYKGDCGGSDENVIFGIQRILLGAPLYQNPNVPDYAIIQYTPLFYYLTAGVARFLHIDAFAIQDLYRVARTINVLLNLLTIALVAGTLRSLGLNNRRVWTFALPVIVIVTSHYYTRIDSLQLFFFTAAMTMYIRYLQQKGNGLLLIAAISCGACVMAKQNGILSVGIIGFSLLFLERKFIIAVAFGLVSVAAAAGFAWLCGGNNWLGFYQNAYLGLKNGIDWSWPYTIFISQFYLDLVLCYITGFIIAVYAFRHTADKVAQFIGTGAVLSFAFAFVTGFKIGSSNNYFTELLLFLLLGLPLLLQSDYSRRFMFRIAKWPVTVGRFAGIAFFVLVTSKTMGFFTSVYIERRLVSDRAMYENGKALKQYFSQQLHLKKGEYIYFTRRDFLDNFFAGNSIMGIKDVIYQTWHGAPGTFDYMALQQGLNNGLVKYIVTGTDEQGIEERAKLEMPMMTFNASKFQRIDTAYGYIIYQYQGGTAQR